MRTPRHRGYLTMKLPNITSVGMEDFNTTVAHLEGSVVNLVRTNENDVDELVRIWQDKPAYNAVGFREAPSRERLNGYLFETERLLVWKAISAESGECVALTGWVLFAGNHFAFFQPFEPDAIDPEIVHNAVELSVIAFFNLTELQRLFFYVFRPVDDAVHEMLVDNGFDPITNDVPRVNDDVRAAYVVTRETFDTYYGEGAEDYGDPAEDY